MKRKFFTQFRLEIDNIDAYKELESSYFIEFGRNFEGLFLGLIWLSLEKYKIKEHFNSYELFRKKIDYSITNYTFQPE